MDVDALSHKVVVSISFYRLGIAGKVQHVVNYV